jgi:hypothetical protein
MAKSRLSKLRWTDVACARCDLSTVVWEEAKFTRVEVRECQIRTAFSMTESLEERFTLHLGGDKGGRFKNSDYIIVPLRWMGAQSCQRLAT